ncbi:Cytochrome P450 4F8 [Vanrija pseudolonga]|uniref:Cytochrome P450 4F8 n=1 Tax=Vanrija pseudolonga TaxID=143232 RepID=A0AAF1BJE9_9TREE|nr:Cytochrome P450 4F8 [Vanrija pseudolonga]
MTNSSLPQVLAPVAAVAAVVAGTSLLVTVPAALVLVALLTWAYLYPYRRASLHPSFANLHGPVNSSAVFGNWRDFLDSANDDGTDSSLPLEWTEPWPTGRIHGFFGTHIFYSTDPGAMSYMLANDEVFQKPPRLLNLLGILVGGQGLLMLEGNPHRRARKAMNPTFGPPAIRELVPLFYDKAFELRDKFASFFDPANDGVALARRAEGDDKIVVGGRRKVDVQKPLAEFALDVIGTAGFSHDTAALNSSPSEFTDAWRAMQVSLGQKGKRELAQLFAMMPVLEKIPVDAQVKMTAYNDAAVKVGKRLVGNKMAALEAAGGDAKSELGRDLVSLLLKSNLASKTSEKMTTDEIVDQIRTFLFAGAETTAVAMSYALWRLGRHPEMQDKLRKEILTVEEDNPSFDTLNGLTYLEYFVREILRIHSPVSNTIRMAMSDVVIPLSKPTKGRDGSLVDSVVLRKGTTVMIPIASVNVASSIWGPDATTFNPDRHATEPTIKTPGIYANLMTFIGGPRNCIGYRFSIAEIKVALFVLLRSFSFEVLPDMPEQRRMPGIDLRSYSLGQGLPLAPEMPLLVRVLE